MQILAFIYLHDDELKIYRPKWPKCKSKPAQMMAFAWQGYAQYAWDNNELAPNSMDSSGGPFDAPMGATIVDAADTLVLT